MGEVSNKSLAALLVVAIVVSLGGTFISLSRLSGIGRIPLITGFAGTDTGIVNITITEDLTIDTPENLIEFGSGLVDINTPDGYAEVYSNGTKDADWINASTFLPDPTYSGTNEDYIIIENLGNVNVNLTVLTSKNSTEYLCDVGKKCEGLREAKYEYWSEDNTSGSCESGYLEGNSSSRTTFNGDGSTKQNVCGSLKSAPDTDTVKLYVYLKVPQNAQGTKNDTLTFTSTNSAYQGS